MKPADKGHEFAAIRWLGGETNGTVPQPQRVASDCSRLVARRRAPGALGGLTSWIFMQKMPAVLIRRISAMECQLEMIEARFSEEPPDEWELTEIHARISSALRRLFETLGIRRVPRNVNDDDFLQRHFNRPFRPPALLTTRGSLIMTSSPWCAEGEFYKTCTSGWGDAGGDRSLVIHGQSHELNPTLEGD
jgi:hypothetical protein